MPEYLAPGVYVEEVSFRSKSIEGVPTSTTGFVGSTQTGPVWYPNGPLAIEPRLITSFTEFERVYGGLEDHAFSLDVAGNEDDPRDNFTAHAARAFFNNGGKRLYVSRVFSPLDPAVDTLENWGIASALVTVDVDSSAIWTARWPGKLGNVHVQVQVVRTKNIAFTHATLGRQARQVRDGSLVEVIPDGSPILKGDDNLNPAYLRVVDVDRDGVQTFFKADGTSPALLDTDIIQQLELRVIVKVDAERVDSYDRLALDPRQVRYIGKILQLEDPEDENSTVWLKIDKAQFDAKPGYAASLAAALRGSNSLRLDNGHDGLAPQPADLQGREADPDVATMKATGLEALGEIDDIAIVAMPDGSTSGDDDIDSTNAQNLIAHAEKYRYRIAVVDGQPGSSMTEIRQFRGKFDSKYAALYHPWIEILDPTERASQGAPPKKLMLPPSGFVTGIYARNDIERGVHKAPANEIVRGLTKFEANINKARQEVLNPEGINALRFFEGRGSRVWGARTLSSDPEWKYVNVRRLFIYIEHSIDKGTQWAVFEPNNDRLWNNIKRTIEDFLYVLWRDGALLGTKPEEAYFVRCDRTTMTQNDLDNGRLIALIGVCPVKPAEFVIFRIGQWTADSKQS